MPPSEPLIMPPFDFLVRLEHQRLYSWEGIFFGLLLVILFSLPCGFVPKGSMEKAFFWSMVGSTPSSPICPCMNCIPSQVFPSNKTDFCFPGKRVPWKTFSYNHRLEWVPRQSRTLHEASAGQNLWNNNWRLSKREKFFIWPDFLIKHLFRQTKKVGEFPSY